MRKALTLSSFALACFASAITPREVANSIASDLNLTAQQTPTCKEREEASKMFSYPSISASQTKHIATFSFTQADSVGIESVKAMIDLFTMTHDMKAVRPWLQTGRSALRNFTHSGTPKYTYSIGVTERPHPTNEFLKTSDICITIEGMRS